MAINSDEVQAIPDNFAIALEYNCIQDFFNFRILCQAWQFYRYRSCLILKFYLHTIRLATCRQRHFFRTKAKPSRHIIIAKYDSVSFGRTKSKLSAIRFNHQIRYTNSILESCYNIANTCNSIKQTFIKNYFFDFNALLIFNGYVKCI